MQELSITGGLDSKFTGPGPAQYQISTTKDSFTNSKANREYKKPNYSFNRASKYLQVKSRSPGPGMYDSHNARDEASSVSVKAKMPIINPPKKYGGNTIANMEKKSYTKSQCGPGRYEIDRNITYKSFRQSFTNSIRKFKLSDSVEVYTPNPYDESRSHGVSRFTGMTRT